MDAFNMKIEEEKVTSRALQRAQKILCRYAAATGVHSFVLDEDYEPIPESLEDDNSCGMACRRCSKAQKPGERRDCAAPACMRQRMNAGREACRFGGSYIYACESGMMFWTSPVFENGALIGALLCSCSEPGRGDSPPEPADRFSDPERIKALAEILLVLAENLSTGPEDYFETLKRRTAQQMYISEEVAALRDQYSQGMAVPGYPLDKERMLLSALRRGDRATGRKILNELLGALFFSKPDEFRFIQFRAIELVVLLSRAALGPGNAESGLTDWSCQFILLIQEAKNTEELTDVLHIILDRTTTQIFSFQGFRHASALQKAERYILENFTRKLSLKEISEVSGLSAPYFSTIFKEEMGENLSSYLNRLRVEEAEHLLLHTNMPLSDIACACGFEDQSWFSKIFKSFTGHSPGKFRHQADGETLEITEDNFSENCKPMAGEEACE